MDYAIATDEQGQGALTGAIGDDLFNNVYISLSIPKGSWWFDRNFGLRRRGRLKNTETTAILIRQDYEAALKWLLDSGKAKEVVVEVKRDLETDRHRHRLTVQVAVTGTDGRVVSYQTFIEVI